MSSKTRKGTKSSKASKSTVKSRNTKKGGRSFKNDSSKPASQTSISKNSMFAKAVSKKELKVRLSKKLSNKKIEQLIDDYVEASLQVLPDMNVIINLAQKNRVAKLLDVRFRLESEQYDALAEYFGEDGQPGTYLVKKAIEEFIV